MVKSCDRNVADLHILHCIYPSTSIPYVDDSVDSGTASFRRLFASDVVDDQERDFFVQFHDVRLGRVLTDVEAAFDPRLKVNHRHANDQCSVLHQLVRHGSGEVCLTCSVVAGDKQSVALLLQRDHVSAIVFGREHNREVVGISFALLVAFTVNVVDLVSVKGTIHKPAFDTDVFYQPVNPALNKVEFLLALPLSLSLHFQPFLFRPVCLCLLAVTMFGFIKP